MKRALILITFVVFASLAGLLFWLKGKTHEIVITQGDIDSALREHFPTSKSFVFIFTLTLSEPKVTLLEENNRIQVAMNAALNWKLRGEEKRFGGNATVAAGLRYDKDKKAFFLDDAELQKLEMQEIPDEHEEKITKAVSEYGSTFLERSPVYRLKGSDAKMLAAKSLLKDVQVRDHGVWVTLGL